MSGRQRSLWAWGYEDAQLNRESQQSLARLAGAALGGVALEAREAPALQALTISEPRIEAPEALASITSATVRARASHTYGKSYRDLVRGLDGDYRPAPDLVLTPNNEDDIASVLEWASNARIAVLPYGGGTSVVGGTEADVDASFAGAVSLDLSRLDQVLEVDDVSLAARIGAGASGPILERQLAAHGLTLRFYPQSFELATLGGWIATRAGGHFATVETHIDDMVSSTRAITPAGVWQTQRLPASGAGPDPNRLMIGSEGALGVITEAWVRVRRRPRFRTRATFAFAEWSAATSALRELAQSRLYPSNCRLLDAREAMLHQVGGSPGKHLLLLGFESTDQRLESRMSDAVAIAVACGGEAVNPPEHLEGDSGRGEGSGESWRDAFLRSPYLFSALVSLGVVVDTFETAVTWDRFAALHKNVKGAALEAMRSLRGVGLISTRITHVYPDGVAPYYTFITTAERGRELETWSAVKEAVSDALADSGGTITHHHAVGRVHDRWYRAERPELFGSALTAAKRELDPAGILNPGVLV